MQGDAAPDLGKGRKRRCHLLNATDRCADTNRVHCKPANLRPACSWLTHTIKQGDAEQTRAAVSINQHLPAQEQRASREARGRINRATEGAQRVALANTCGTLQVEIKKILNLLQQMWVSRALHIKQHWWGTAAKQLFLKGCSKKRVLLSCHGDGTLLNTMPSLRRSLPSSECAGRMEDSREGSRVGAEKQRGDSVGLRAAVS